jgi:leucyl aminopeptidase
MEIDAVDTAPAKVDADVLAFAVPDPVDLPPNAQEIDGLLEGGLRHLIDDGELKGKLGRTTLAHTEGRLAAHRVAAAGVGSPGDLDADALRTAAATVAIRTGEVGGRSIAWVLDRESSTLSPAEQVRAIVDGTGLGPYDAGQWKTGENDTRPAIERLVFCGPGASALADDAQRANVVVSWTNRCRDFVNAPPNECTPARLAEWAEETAGRFDSLSFEALGPEEIRSAGMGALAAVSQGSTNPPRLIKLLYEPPGAKEGLVLGLVGKAITFDAGGLSLKPADRMEEMKSDMGGGAAVLAAVGAIAELGLPIRLLAVVPSCENMPGGHAYRPGDIITAINGNTI